MNWGKSLFGFLFVVGQAAVALTHSQIVDPKNDPFPQVAMICTPFTGYRATAIAVGKRELLTVGHLFFDYPTWHSLLVNNQFRINELGSFSYYPDDSEQEGLNKIYIGREEFEVEEYIIPSNYIPEIRSPVRLNVKNDLTYVVLKKPHGRKIAEIVNGSESPYGRKFFLIGHGKDVLSFDSSSPTYNCKREPLQKRFSQVSNPAVTSEYFALEADDHSVKTSKPRSGSTKGDSGGPMMDEYGRVWGVASTICCSDPHNGQYTSNYTNINATHLQKFVHSFLENKILRDTARGTHE